MSMSNGEHRPRIGIGEVPVVVGVTQVVGPAGPRVLLQVESPVGAFCFVLDGETAITAGQNLRQAGKATKAGLVLPGEGA